MAGVGMSVVDKNVVNYAPVSGHNWIRRTFAEIKRYRRILIGLLLLVFMYGASYSMLSYQGRYEPAMIGSNGVKWYEWAPAGFVSDYKWSRGMLIFYFAANQLDRRYWHSPN